MATLIVNHVGTFDDHGLNPVGYQAVLYFTLTLYIIAMVCSVFLVNSKKGVKNAKVEKA